MRLLPERRRGPELIDLPPGNYTGPEYAENLADIRRVNRYLGDRRAVLRFFSDLATDIAADRSGPIRVLDVATGSADIPMAIVDWARKHGIVVAVTAVDVNTLAIHEAASLTQDYPEITLAVADGLSLPYDDGSFDIVLCSKTVHHFAEKDAAGLLKEIERVAAVGYIIMDIRRSWLAWALITMLTRVFSRNRLTRNDGPLSVLRSYTIEELDALAGVSGLAGYTLKREPFWRTVLSGRKA